MNKVNDMIKRLLLEYPTLYKSRTDVLYSIFFMSGAGYEWDAKGCIYNSFGTPNPTEMKFSDLDERLERLAEDEERFKGLEALNNRNAMIRAEIYIERKTREIIAENIDVFASVKPSDRHFHKIPSYISEYGIIATAPYGAIDSEWLAAFEEVMEAMQDTFNSIYSLHLDKPHRGEKAPEPSMFSRMPASSQKVFLYLKDIGDKLEAQSGVRARRAKMLEAIIGGEA